jgi:flavin-dependent dehydrogenase
VWRSIDFAAGPREHAWLTVSPTQARRHGDNRQIRVRLVVGADGSWSSVAGRAGVGSRRRFYNWKSGITFHRRDDDALADGQPMHGRFLFGKGWYVGVAPVPGGRVNVGIVAPGPWLQERPQPLVERLLAAFPEPQPGWLSSETTDEIRVAGGLSWAVSRAAGDGFLLVGDAAGFIDPLTGEGLHRALVSAELAAEAVGGWLDGDRRAMEVYDRRLRSRFRSKDIVSRVLQAFLARPELLDYAVRRLASRRRHREVLTLVLTDQLPATRALDPRFLLRLLAP